MITAYHTAGTMNALNGKQLTKSEKSKNGKHSKSFMGNEDREGNRKKRKENEDISADHTIPVDL